MIKKIKEILNIQNKSQCRSEFESQKQGKLNAFTLAEVLVVIGIIGVVSALTIPNLQQGTNSKEVVTKVTKARATFGEATGRAIANYGDSCTWALNQSTAAAQASAWYDRILENLKVDKKCGLVGNTNTVCWNGDNLNASWYKVKLADGTSLAIYAWPSTITKGYGCKTAGTAISVVVDIDGPSKGSGSYCDDLYQMSFDAAGGSAMSYSGNLTTAGCAAWVLENQNADFLKATYSDSSFKCKNGTILNWSTNKTCN